MREAGAPRAARSTKCEHGAWGGKASEPVEGCADSERAERTSDVRGAAAEQAKRCDAAETSSRESGELAIRTPSQGEQARGGHPKISSQQAQERFDRRPLAVR